MKVTFVPTNINILLAINEFRCYEAKIEESEKAGNHRELNPGHLWLELAALCHWAMTAETTTNPLYVWHRWYWMPQLHNWQPLSMCCHSMCRQNSISTCAVYIEDCEGWWLAGCRGAMAEHWQLKPDVSWVWLLTTTRLSLSSAFHKI